MGINNNYWTKIMNKEDLRTVWGAENTESDEIKEEKRRVIQEIAHDDINSENLT